MSTLDIVFDIGGLRFRSGLIDDRGVVSNLVTLILRPTRTSLSSISSVSLTVIPRLPMIR